MNTKVFSFLACGILALTFASSCNKESALEITVTPETSANFREFSFVTIQEGSESKTTINDQNVVNWEVGDQIKFAYELDGTANYVTSSALEASDINGSTAIIKASLPDAFAMTLAEYTAAGGKSLHLYATYPASTEVDYSTASTFYATVPATQDGSFGNAAIAFAKWDNTAPTAPLSFKNLCGLLKIKVTDNDVRRIVFSSSTEIAGKASISFNTGAPTIKSVSDGSTQISVSVPGAGTYYIGVLPNVIDNITVSLYNGADAIIGNKAGSSALSIGRRQLCNLGTIETGFSDRFYVKADGSGDGSSWDNAASYSSLQTRMAANDKVDIYMAAGTYSVTSQTAPGTGTTSANVCIRGGYPATATGHDLSNRDITTNATTLDAGNASRIWILQAGSWKIDGLTFTNATRAGGDTGSALIFEGKSNPSFSVSNCTFTANSNTGTIGGGAVRVSGATVKMSDCTFTNNSATKDGGALYVNSTGTLLMENCVFNENSANIGGAIAIKGNLTAVNCDFGSNKAEVSAGALYSLEAAVVKLDCCTFRTNAANGEGESNGGGAMWVIGTSKAYLNRCFLANNTSQYNAFHIYSGQSSWVGLNNCVVRGPWGANPKQGSMLQIKGYNVIVNTTIYSQTGQWGSISLGSKDANGCRVINDIVINKSKNQYSFLCTSYYIQLYNTIYSVIQNKTEGYGATDPEGTCLGGASCRDDGNFPTASALWSGDGERYYYDGTRYGYCYTWNGTTDAGTVTHNSLDGIKTLISGTTNIGADFLAWLESDELKVNGTEALAVDIRGSVRNTSAMWPGAYEEAASTASAPSFNLQ